MNSKQLEIEEFADQFSYFPGTRYMGSKNKIIHNIWDILKEYEFNSFFDAFAGSNVVGYFMKSKGKRVYTNDFMTISYITAKAIIENSRVLLDSNDVDFLLNNSNKESYISQKFKDLYFTAQDNLFLDKVRFNTSMLKGKYKQAVALSALVRSCMKKNDQGVFSHLWAIDMTMGEKTSESRCKITSLTMFPYLTKQFLTMVTLVKHTTHQLKN